MAGGPYLLEGINFVEKTNKQGMGRVLHQRDSAFSVVLNTHDVV